MFNFTATQIAGIRNNFSHLRGWNKLNEKRKSVATRDYERHGRNQKTQDEMNTNLETIRQHTVHTEKISLINDIFSECLSLLAWYIFQWHSLLSLSLFYWIYMHSSIFPFLVTFSHVRMTFQYSINHSNRPFIIYLYSN